MGLRNRYRYQLVLFEKPAMTSQELESALSTISGQVDEAALRRLVAAEILNETVTVAESNSKSGISSIQSHLKRAKCDAVLVDAGFSPRATVVEFLDGVRQPATRHDSGEAKLDSGQSQKAMLVLGLVMFGLVALLALGQLFGTDQSPERTGGLSSYVTELEKLTPEEQASRTASSQKEAARDTSAAAQGSAGAPPLRMGSSEPSESLFDTLGLVARLLPLVGLLFGLIMGALLQRQALMQLRGERKPSPTQWAVLSAFPLVSAGLCGAILVAPSSPSWQPIVLSFLFGAAGSAVFLTFFALTARPQAASRASARGKPTPVG